MHDSPLTWRTGLQWLLAITLTFCGVDVPAQAAAPDALRARFEALRQQADGNLFDRPVYLHSSEEPSRSHGDVDALIDHPFASLRHALTQADHWCGVLMLHLNVQSCRASAGADHATMEVGIGRKLEQPLGDLYWVKFDFKVVADGGNHLRVVMLAPTGPLATKDFRIELEAAPYAGDKSVVHLTYGYGYGLAARWAMQAYLASLGRGKVGFSIAGQGVDGRPQRVAGVRGVLERNTVRYYLAMEAYLDAQSLPPEQQWRSGLENWFAATERYPQQLHELERDDYLTMKLRQIKRLAAPAPVKN